MSACTYALTHRHKKNSTYQYNFYSILSDNYKNYKNVNCLAKVRQHTGMHPACMHVNTCTCIPQHTSTSIQLKRAAPVAEWVRSLNFSAKKKKKKKVKVSYLTWIVYESPHLVWMERLISSRVHGACHYLPDYPV